MDFIFMLCLLLLLVSGLILGGAAWLVGTIFLLTVCAAIGAWKRTK
jgi:hypothetical protein